MIDLYNYFENLVKNNKLSHSFLIGNVFFDDIKEDFTKIVNNLLLKSSMKIEENPDVFILKNMNMDIGKDDIKELIENINKTSQFHNAKVYVIENCETLNDFACNALLKTLEEPPQNVYAILLSSNISDVKDTISSRCQKILVSSSVDQVIQNEELIEISDKFIDYIEKDNINIIVKDNDIYSLISDRKCLIEVLKIMIYKYKESLDKLLNNEKNDIINKNNDINEISKKIIVINDNLNRLNVPLNKNLAIDRLIIEMWRCKNENC